MLPINRNVQEQVANLFPLHEQLAEKNTKNKQQVNHAVSFNAIKNLAVELLCSDLDTNLVLERLENLFLTNPVSYRNQRHVPRRKRSARQLLNHTKRQRKISF